MLWCAPHIRIVRTKEKKRERKGKKLQFNETITHSTGLMFWVPTTQTTDDDSRAQYLSDRRTHTRTLIKIVKGIV